MRFRYVCERTCGHMNARSPETSATLAGYTAFICLPWGAQWQVLPGRNVCCDAVLWYSRASGVRSAELLFVHADDALSV